MHRIALLAALVVAVPALSGPPDGKGPKMPPPLKLKPLEKGTAPAHKYTPEQIKRGGYLVGVAGCNHCHTPWVFNPDLGGPAPDMSRMLSGHPSDAPDPIGDAHPQNMALIGPTFTSFKLPFGVVYAPNLTPDNETGSGTWTEEMWVKIFRTGKHLGGNGRPVLPPMPWLDLAQMSDDDLKAVFAFLRSIPPLKNGVPSPKVPEPVLMGMDKAREKMLQMTKH